jgi:hypothetical protein
MSAFQVLLHVCFSEIPVSNNYLDTIPKHKTRLSNILSTRTPHQKKNMYLTTTTTKMYPITNKNATLPMPKAFTSRRRQKALYTRRRFCKFFLRLHARQYLIFIFFFLSFFFLFSFFFLSFFFLFSFALLCHAFCYFVTNCLLLLLILVSILGNPQRQWEHERDMFAWLWLKCHFRLCA